MERRVQDRVPLYLIMEQEATALKEASEAHDADLMLFAALQIWLRWAFRTLVVMSRWKNGAIPNDRFASLITGFPEIGDILEEYLEIRGEDVESLLRAEGRLDWRRHVTGRIDVLCEHLLRRAFRQGCDFEQRVAYVKQIQSEITAVLSVRKELDFWNKTMAEHVKLLSFQKELFGVVKDRRCLELSAFELVRFCCLKAQMKQADRIRALFKISEKKWAFRAWMRRLGSGD